MSDETAEQRARRDTDELEQRLGRAIRGSFSAQAVRVLAEQLVSEGWTKLGPNEKVVTPMSAEDATRIVARALLRWEEHKAEAEKQGKGPNWARDAAKRYAEQGTEVSSDSSELTSGVKGPSPESLILAAFAGADRPLSYTEACDAAASAPVPFFPERPWHRWNAAFRSLEDRGLIEPVPHEKGEVRRYVLTQAGRGLHELDGVEL